MAPSQVKLTGKGLTPRSWLSFSSFALFMRIAERVPSGCLPHGGQTPHANPPLTEWLRHATRDPDERRWAFEKTFGIELAIGKDEEVRFAYQCHRDAWYSRRNGMAHGEASLNMKPAEYWRAEDFVCASIDHLARECRTKQMLIV